MPTDLAPAPAEYRLKSTRFRDEREAQWAALEDLLQAIEAGGLKRLDADALHRLPSLYRAALSSLSVARAISLDKNVVAYLEALCSRAYLAVYCRERYLGHTVWDFLARGFPRLVRSMRWALALSVGLMSLGIAVGFLMTEAEPDRFFTFVGGEMAGERSPDASRDELVAVLYSDGGGGAAELTHFASALFTRNARIGLMCFALGFVAGVPVMLLLFINGLSLGAMWAVYAAKGAGFDFMAWVLPHGVTELLAVCLCGAAGLAVGHALVFPGRHRRVDSLARRGRQSAAVVVGAVLLFFIAALLEGFFRQLVGSTDVRVIVISATAALWTVYFGWAGRSGSKVQP